MLPHAMEFNLPAASDRLALVAGAAGVHPRKLNIQQAAQAAVEAVRRLVKDLGCPARLRDVGVKESDLPMLAEAVIHEAPLMENPRPITEMEVIGILRKAW
jgi:alcohol dehydrogenase class IV